MKAKKIEVSVIIPVRTITGYVKETVDCLKKQTEKNFEIIIITDLREKLSGAQVIFSGEPTPSFKRNLGAEKARGKILAFLDDDSYPDKNWLKNALRVFNEKDNPAAVCGPSLTPPADNIYQKASGWVWATWLGSGGAGVYRNRIMKKREVQDFPSVNLLIKKESFKKINGFDVKHWPGEDTKLCLDLVNSGGKIIYDPKVIVYHHRRPVLIPHLKQISRYAKRRGYFAKVFPRTSFKIGYLMPSFFVFGLLFGAIVSVVFPFFKYFYFSGLAVYIALLFFTFVDVYKSEKNLYLSFLVLVSIIATHLFYGFIFIFGYFQKKIVTIPHKVDLKKGRYVGG